MAGADRSDVEYQALEDGGVRRVEGREFRWKRIVAAVVVMAVVCGAIGAVVAAAGNAAPENKPKTDGNSTKGPWSTPRAYKVRVVMKLPYSGLVENALVYTDNDQGAQRIEFYPGTDHESVHLFNSSGSGFQILPILTDKRCYEEPPGSDARGVPPQDIFPKHFHDLFVEETTTEPLVINGVTCKSFKYENHEKTGDEDGYLGTYRFYLDAVRLQPVQVRFVGHNIFMGGSHIDEYILDYSEFVDLTEQGGVEPKLFRVPDGMACTNARVPTKEQAASEEEQTERRIAGLHPPVEHELLFPHSHEPRSSLFEEHMETHGLEFSDPDEKRFRERVYHSNRRHIHARNRQGKEYTLAVNHLAHKTDAELQEMRGSRHNSLEQLCRTETYADIMRNKGNSTLPPKVDWWGGSRKLVLPPGDQGSCGSCWTFAATGAMEAAIAKSTGKLVPLSKQNILDCALDIPYLNHGCGGGGDFKAYEWVINNNQGKIATEDSYPYLNEAGVCHFDVNRSMVQASVVPAPALITDCVVVTERYLNNSWVSDDRSVDAFLHTLATQGPLAISINAEPKDLYFYSSGVFSSDACPGDVVHLDHAVLAVGYDLDHDYVVMRNSWSTHWGEQGFARLRLRSNTCGYATAPTYTLAVPSF